MNKIAGKRIVAAFVSVAMMSSCIPMAFAEDSAGDEELVNELLSYSEEYPDGAFAFLDSQLEANEDDGEIYIDVVRYGSFEGDASVSFKAIDVSATYGKDYTLSVGDGWFLSHKLEQDEDAMPLMELYTDTSSEYTIGEEAENEEADAEEQVIQMAIDGESGELLAADNSAEPEEKAPATGLRAARNTYIGNESDRKSWQEITGADSEKVAEAQSDMENVPDYIGEFADGLPGTEHVLHFSDGEYKKRVKINLIDDDVSETDEQVMFIVYDSEGADIAKPQSAYLNIIDTDENEHVVFYIDNKSVTVTPDDNYASVTVKRDSGIEKFATVTVGTGAIDAQPDVDYKSGSVEVVFPQGVTERTVKIPVYNAMRSEAVSFAVAIDKETAFVDENRYGTLVTVEPRVSEEETELYSEASEITSEEGDNTRIYRPKKENNGIMLMSDLTLDPGEYDMWLARTPWLSTAYCDFETAVDNLDLRNAESIEVSYHMYWNKVPATSFETRCKIGSATTTISVRPDERFPTATVTNFPKQKGQSLEFQVRSTKLVNDTFGCSIDSIKIHYYDITVSIDNTTYDTNKYKEKIYEAGTSSTNQGLGCKDGNTIKLGDGFLDGTSTKKTVRYFSSPVNFTVKGVSGQKTSQGIAPEVGRNVYIAGWQLYDENHNKYLDDIISVDDMSMEAIYSYAVKSKQADRRAFMVRPVLKPYPSMIRFNNSWKDLLAYTNNISDGKEISATMLDTINLEGVPVKNSGKAVDKFLINGYLDKDAHMKSGSARANRIAELEKASKSEGDRTAYLNSHKNATDEVSVDINAADSSKIVLTPDCEAVYVDMSYTTPKIDVKYNPSRAAVTQYKDKGKVVYVNQETETSLDGDYDSTMTIQPVDYGHVFNMNALYTDTDESKYISDYKTIWQDFTGDLDGDGELSTSEVEALSRYDLDRAPSTGDTFDYKPKVTNSLIYYQFVRREKVQGEGGIYGIVMLKDYPVFEGKTKYKPINGATVTVDGHTGVTNYDADFGGEKGTGGDGYFSFRDRTFVAGESHRVNVEYGPLSTSAVHHVNVAQTYILDSYDTISVIFASRAKNGSTMKSMKTDPMLNDDASYTLTFNTKSSISAKVATKAKLTFYRKDKTIITTQEYDSTGENTGVFDCTFNPKTLGIPAGASITVQFIDNDGVAYFEHDTGLYFMQSLGMLSLMSSFSGGANSAFQVIGQIGMLFGFGWDGNLDDDKGKVDDELLDFVDYSISTTGEKKVLKLNIKFDTKGKLGDDKKKDDKSDSSGGADKDALKEDAKSNDSSKVKDAAKKADGGKKKSEGKLTNSYKLKFSFGLELDLKAADDPQHKGEWAFDEFLIVINAEGSLSFSTTYVTPIGIPITFGLTVGAEGEAIFVVESRLGTNYYMTDLLGDNSGTVDMLKKGHSLDEYMYTYGKFRIKPYIDISVTVGWTGFKAWLDGHAEMNFSYNMKDEKFEGSVYFNCTLSIKIIFFKKSWTLVGS